MRFTKEAVEAKQKLRMPIVGAVKAFNEAERTITFIASTETVDRYGDTIKVDGWDTSNYEKNPVVLWAHDAGQLPVGKCIGIQKQLGQSAALIQKVQFATADENPFADSVFKLYKGGYLNAVSVGFLPTAYEFRFENDKEGNPAGWPIGTDFLKQELLELSCVPVPANPEAIALMHKSIADGLHGAELAKACLFGVVDKAVSENAITNEEAAAYKAALSASMEEKSLLIGDGVQPEQGQPSVKPTTQPEQPTGPAPDTDGDGDQAAAPKQPTGDGDPVPGGAPDAAAPAWMNDCMKQFTDAVGDLKTKLDYAISDEGLKSHNSDMARSVANLHTKVDSLHSKLNGKAAEEITAKQIVIVVDGNIDAMKAALAEAQKAVDEVVAATKATTDELEAKSVCPYKKEKLSERDAAWDAGKEMGDATEPAQWKRMCTIIDGDADQKGSYKLPHHRGPSGEFETVFKGVVAALGRLEQTDASEEDIAGARKHLTKHRAEFGDSFDAVTFEAGLEALGKDYRTAKKEGSAALTMIFDSMLEQYVESKAALAEVPLPVDGNATKKDAPETVAVPEKNDSDTQSVNSFMAKLLGKK